MNFYRRFPGDYANDTRHLTFAEHGAYTLLLDYCYATEKPLPKDKEEIYRKMCARTAQDRAVIDRVLAEFFQLRRQGYVQARVKEEIAFASRKSEVRRVSGRKGGLKRQANAKQLLSKTQASQTLDSRLQTSDPQDRSAAAAVNGELQKLAAAAFTDLGFEKPFGRPNFQAIYVTHYVASIHNGTWLTEAMEDTIQECQKLNIGVPPQFYDAKHDVEVRERAAIPRRTPL